MSRLPLAGIRVLDLTRLLPGPFCSLLLADMGADVIKVEQPGSGDGMRHYPPLREGQSVAFNAVNRNKRSITLNLKAPQGRELFLSLVATADCVLEGNRPGVMDRLGLGWPVLRERNPRLVLCSITGYGQDSPWVGRAGHDLNYLATNGVLSLSAPRGGAPHPPPVQVADLGGGAQAAATSILAALLDVARGGEGRWLDVAMTDATLGWISTPLAETEAAGPLPHDEHRLTGRYACYAVYACRDGRYLSVAALEAKFFIALCQELGRPDLVPLHLDRDRQDELRAELASVFRTRDRDTWGASLGPDTCCEPVLEVWEVPAHPHVRARGLIADRATGREVAPPVPMGQGWRRADAPGLGEHNAEVLREVGVGPDALDELAAAGVV
ncbi:MAG: CoA transferase [Candidatus Dormibacteraeota bacterium]|nr:CoA transferase [Candidatus Dormibacteraeota bacterium]